MKKSFIAASGLALLMGSGISLAQWNNETFPSFEEVDANKDGMISMDEAKAHPGTVAAVTKGNLANVEDSMKSFFSAAHQHDKNKPYDSPMTKDEWQSMTSH
mgnify:FL=1